MDATTDVMRVGVEPRLRSWLT